MAKQKKKGAASSRRRASLKSFAARAKGMFQSPVHSNGFKQDMLIDMHGGDVGFEYAYGHPSPTARAEETLAAGKTFFKQGGNIYKATTTTGRGGATVYVATLHSRPGKVK